MKKEHLRYLKSAILIYTVGVVIIVAAHLIMSHTYLLDVQTSISRYMGMKMWSTIVYIFLVLTVSSFLFKYLKCPDLPRYYRMIGYVVIVSFFSIAIFPYGAFGCTVTDIHRVLSRVIFLSMMIHSASGIKFTSKTKKLFAANMIILAIDITLLVTVIAAYEVFMAYVFICEFVLIYAYFASLIVSYKALTITE